MDDCVRGPVSFHRLSFLSSFLSCERSKASHNFVSFSIAKYFFPSLIESLILAESVSFYSESILDCATTTMIPSLAVARVVFKTFCLRGLPPSRTSPPENAFQGVDHRIGSFIANPSHVFSPIFGNHFFKKGKPISTHISRPFCRFLCNGHPMFLPVPHLTRN